MELDETDNDTRVTFEAENNGYSFLARERPDLVALNRTTVDRYYRNDESQESLERGSRPPQFCVVDGYAAVDALPYPPESADEIRTVQVLEHVPMKDTARVLRHWYETLRPGGLLHLDVPDFEETARQLLAQPDEPSRDWYYRLIYGSQKNDYAYHRNGFSPARVERLLRAAGFERMRHLPNTLHFYPVVITEAIR